MATVTTAVFAAIAGMCSAAFGQTPHPQDKASSSSQVKISKRDTPQDGGVVSGTVLDPNGAVIAGATVLLTDSTSRKNSKVTTTDDGKFQFGPLVQGDYTVTINCSGFSSFTVKEVHVEKGQLINMNVTLRFDSTTSVVGILTTDDAIDTSPNPVIIMKLDYIKRLPIQNK
jgi:hypothetical protein